MYRGESRTTSFFMLPEDTNRLVIETQGYFGSCDEMPTLAESAQVQIDRLSREGFTIEYINDAQEVSDVPAIEIQAGRLTEIPGAFRENGRDWNGMYHSTLMFFQNNCTTWQVFGGADEDHVEEVKSVYDKMLEDLYFNVRTTGG
jgi:hypothetical protein